MVPLRDGAGLQGWTLLGRAAGSRAFGPRDRQVAPVLGRLAARALGAGDLTAEQLLTLGAAAYELDPGTLTNLVVDGQVGTAGKASVVFLTDEAFSTFEDLTDGVLEGD